MSSKSNRSGRQLRKLSARMKDEITDAAATHVRREVARERGYKAPEGQPPPYVKSFAQTSEFTKLCDAAYRETFSSQERQRMNKLPEGWLPEADNITARFPRELLADGEAAGTTYVTLRFSRKMRFPHAMHTGCAYVQLSTREGSAGRKIIDGHKKDKQDNLRLDSAARRTREFLSSMTTTAKLLQAWPEVERLMPRDYFFEGAAPGTAIVAKSEELNKLLGLT